MTSHSQLLIPNPCFPTFSGGFAANMYGREAPFLFSLPRVGKAAIREQRYPRHLPLEGKVASGASRIGF